MGNSSLFIEQKKQELFYYHCFAGLYAKSLVSFCAAVIFSSP
jgi:hypothetical protein